MLAQIETDKVTIDVRYTEAQPGVVSKVLIKDEDTVSVGQECFVVDVGASGGKESGRGGGGEKDAPKQEAAPPQKEEKKAESKPAEKPPPAEKPKPAEKSKPALAPASPAPKSEVGGISGMGCELRRPAALSSAHPSTLAQSSTLEACMSYSSIA